MKSKEKGKMNIITELIPTIKIVVLGMVAWIISGIESFTFLFQSINQMQDIELISSYLGLIIKAVTLISVIAVAITNIYKMMNHKNYPEPENDNEDGSSGAEPPEGQ
jgi:hypothetical protein